MREVVFRSRPFRLLATALVLAVLLASIPLSIAYADTPTPRATPKVEVGQGLGQGLTWVYKAEQAWLDRQGEQLEKANQALAKAQELAAAAKNENGNATTFAAALAAFKDDIAKAQAAHDKAAQILTAHGGFDDKGNVADMKAALQTLKDARRAMLDAHLLTLRAVQDLRKGVRGWRGDHPTPTPKPAS